MQSYQLIQIKPLQKLSQHPNPSMGFPAILSLQDGREPPFVDDNHKYIAIIAKPSYNGSLYRLQENLTTESLDWEIAPLTPEEIRNEQIASFSSVEAWRMRTIAKVVPYPYVSGLLVTGDMTSLHDAAVASIAGISDPFQKAAAEEIYLGGMEIRRTSPTLNALASGLGLAEADLDNLFVQAKSFDI